MNALPIFFACQWCKELASFGLAKGFAWTIGMLLSVPFLLVGGIAWMLVRSARRQQARQAK